MSRQLWHLPILRALRRSGSEDHTSRRVAAVAIPLAVLMLMIGLVLVTGGAPADRAREAARQSGSAAKEFGEQLEVGQAPLDEATDSLAPGSSKEPGASGRSGSQAAASIIPAPSPSTRLPGVKGDE